MQSLGNPIHFISRKEIEMVRNYLMRARYFHRVIKARYRNQHSELNVILSNLHQGDVALDIGANKGAYLYWMRKAVGIDGKVYAYEPQPALASYLKLLCTAMKWNNVFVHNCALSDRTGGGTLYIPGDSDSPSASLDPAVLKSQTGHHYECRIDTLDHQMEHVVRRVGWIMRAKAPVKSAAGVKYKLELRPNLFKVRPVNRTWAKSVAMLSHP